MSLVSSEASLASLTRLGGDPGTDAAPLIKIEKISYTPNHTVNKQTGKKVSSQERKLKVKATLHPLPDTIRVRPDLRHSIKDDEIVTWHSMAMGPRQKSKIFEDLDAASMLSNDTKEMLEQLSEKERLRRIQALRTWGGGMSPKSKNKKFKDYVISLVANGIESFDAQALKDYMSYANSGDDSLNAEAIASLLSMHMNEEIPDAMSVSKLTNPRYNNEELSTNSHASSAELSINKQDSLHLYRVTNPAPSSPQAAGVDPNAGPLYYDSMALDQERLRKNIRSEPMIVARTTLKSRESPVRRDDEEFFDDRPLSPSSPFVTRAERVQEMLTQSNGRSGGLRTQMRSAAKAHKSTAISNSKRVASCIHCLRAASLYCPECTASFCPACWTKVPRHEFIKEPEAWDDFRLLNSGPASPARLNLSREAPRYTCKPLGTHPLGDVRMAADERSAASADSITQSVILSASGRLIQTQIQPDELESDSLKEEVANFAKSIMVDLSPAVLSTTFLSAMAMQSHQHALAKKELATKTTKVANEWAFFELAGSLPPVKLNKLNDDKLERLRILRNYALARRRSSALGRDKCTGLPRGAPLGETETVEQLLDGPSIPLLDDSIVTAGGAAGDAPAVSQQQRTAKKHTRSTPCIAYVDPLHGSGISTSYGKNPSARAIVGITSEVGIPLQAAGEMRTIGMFSGLAVYTVDPSRTDGGPVGDVMEMNQKRRDRERRLKERKAFAKAKKDCVLDKLNPFLVETFGRKYKHMAAFREAKTLPTYGNLPAPLPISIKKTAKLLALEKESLSDSAVLMSEMGQVEEILDSDLQKLAVIK